MADNSIPAATDGNFEAEVLAASNSKPVMVDFWAEWCRPCHMLAPTVAEIAHDYEGKLKVTKLNVAEAMNSAGRYNIRGIRSGESRAIRKKESARAARRCGDHPEPDEDRGHNRECRGLSESAGRVRNL